jgi:eukaryotic-like serine/threonine-protein kinase
MPSIRLRVSRSPRPGSYRIRTRVWSAGRLFLLVVALGITFATFFLTAMRVTSRAREVKVPDISGKSLTEATALLAEAGLVLKIDMRKADASVAADHVLSQEPLPGTVLRRQRAVGVRVSEGKREPVVPMVIGQAERTAEIILAQDQIEVGGRAEIRSASYSLGAVVAQDPVAKTRAAKVTLLVNRGGDGVSFVMPDLIGAQQGRVVDILRRRGFRVTVAAEVPYPGIPAGIVIRQTPQAGFQVSYGAPVAIEVSR